MTDRNEKAVKAMIELFNELNQELPGRTAEGLAEIEKLDQETKEKTEELHKRRIYYMKRHKDLTPEQLEGGFQYIQDAMAKLVKIGDKKLQIAAGIRKRMCDVLKTYDETDKNFIENWEVEEEEPVPEKPVEPKDPPKTAKSGRKSKIAEKEEEVEAPEEKKKVKRGRKRKNEVVKEKEEEEDDDGEEKEEEGGEEAAAADDDGRRWCWCKMNKDGEDMVCCDNDVCPLAWFHFSCIGITRAPAGRWFCCTACKELGDEQERLRTEEKQKKQQQRGIKRKK
ncbi:unnamed protein product [Caenorhabditis sp. 36 PRJEB53466]|nr:unnamed protein product [Caenorhabditis sp. 36 PRJEB53466]